MIALAKKDKISNIVDAIKLAGAVPIITEIGVDGARSEMGSEPLDI